MAKEALLSKKVTIYASLKVARLYVSLAVAAHHARISQEAVAKNDYDGARIFLNSLPRLFERVEAVNDPGKSGSTMCVQMHNQSQVCATFFFPLGFLRRAGTAKQSWLDC